MAVVAVLASAAGALLLALQVAVRLGPRLTPGEPATVGYATSSCAVDGGRVAFSLWFPTAPRPALPYFSYLQSQAARPAPPWVLPGPAGRVLAALTLTLAPHLFRSTAVSTTSTAHWRRSSAADEAAPQAGGDRVGSGGLVILVQGFEAFSFIAAELCEALAARGNAVAAIDLSQHEAVEARLGAVRALLAHVLETHRQHLDPERVAVVGHSRGGSQCAHLALSDARVRGAVLLHSNAGDMTRLLETHPLERQPKLPPPPLLIVHATDDTAVRPDNHTAWVDLLDEHAPAEAQRWHALVPAPCGHDGCTSLLTMLSFAMPRWIFATLSRLSQRRITALRTVCPPGVTEPRATQLVALTAGYVCEFVEAVLSPALSSGSQADRAAGDRQQQQQQQQQPSATEISMADFDATAVSLHRAGLWRLCGASTAADDTANAAGTVATDDGTDADTGRQVQRQHQQQQQQRSRASQRASMCLL
jgi:dienelactone hydrolase